MAYYYNPETLTDHTAHVPAVWRDELAPLEQVTETFTASVSAPLRADGRYIYKLQYSIARGAAITVTVGGAARQVLDYQTSALAYPANSVGVIWHLGLVEILAADADETVVVTYYAAQSSYRDPAWHNVVEETIGAVKGISYEDDATLVDGKDPVLADDARLHSQNTDTGTTSATFGIGGATLSAASVGLQRVDANSLDIIVAGDSSARFTQAGTGSANLALNRGTLTAGGGSFTPAAGCAIYAKSVSGQYLIDLLNSSSNVGLRMDNNTLKLRLYGPIDFSTAPTLATLATNADITFSPNGTGRVKCTTFFDVAAQGTYTNAAPTTGITLGSDHYLGYAATAATPYIYHANYPSLVLNCSSNQSLQIKRGGSPVEFSITSSANPLVLATASNNAGINIRPHGTGGILMSSASDDLAVRIRTSGTAKASTLNLDGTNYSGIFLNSGGATPVTQWGIYSYYNGSLAFASYPSPAGTPLACYAGSTSGWDGIQVAGKRLTESASGVVAAGINISLSDCTAATGKTVAGMAAIVVPTLLKSGAGSLTNAYGIYINAQSAGGTTNYGIGSAAPIAVFSGTTLNSVVGTAGSAFGGRVAVGATTIPASGAALQVTGAATVSGALSAAVLRIPTAAPASGQESDGDCWFDKANDVLKVYNSTTESWVTFTGV